MFKKNYALKQSGMSKEDIMISWPYTSHSKSRTYYWPSHQRSILEI